MHIIGLILLFILFLAFNGKSETQKLRELHEREAAERQRLHELKMDRPDLFK